LRDRDTLLPGGRFCAREGIGVAKFEVFALVASLFAKGVEVASQSESDANVDRFVVFFTGTGEGKGAAT